MLSCSCCGGKLIKKGTDVDQEGNVKQRFKCKDCGRHVYGDIGFDVIAKRYPKILTFDIETLPMEGHFWRLGEQRLNPSNVTLDWSVLSWSAKWLNAPDYMLLPAIETGLYFKL